MAKFFKYLFGTILTLILLCIIGIGILVYSFNPNSLKGQITQQVKTQTGHAMLINGNIAWKFFPWLGFSIQGIQLSNNASFDQTQNFLSLNSADVDIKLIPLFSGNIEIGKLSLDGLKLNLSTNSQGQNNWDDLVKSRSKQIAAATPTPSNNNSNSKLKFKLNTLKISGIDISNASVIYNNLKTNQKYSLTNFNLQTQNINLNSTSPKLTFPITMSFAFNSTNPNINGQVNLDTTVDINQNAEIFSVSPFILNTTLNGAQFPNGGITIHLQTTATLNKSNATLDIAKLSGKIANMAFSAKLGGINIFTNPTFNGNVTIDSFNPKILLQNLGLKTPGFQNKNALSSVSLNSQFILTPTILAINNLKLGLDQTTITGNVHLAQTKTAPSQFNLNIDKIDLSNYLTAATANTSSSASTAVAPSPAQATAAASQLLPLQQLRQLNLTGKLSIGTLNYQKFQMTNVNLSVSANNGLLQFAPNTANLYQGQWQSSIALNVQTNSPAWQINEVVNNVQIAPLINAFYANTKYQVTGTGNIKTSLTTSGNTVPALTQNLNGSAQVALNNGVINGINLGYQMDSAMALVNRQIPPTKPNANQTPFGSLTGTAQITNGLLTNNDLSLQSPALQATGKGTVNLVTQQVHYQMESSAIQGQVDPKIYALQEKIGGSFPIIIAGTFSNLKIYPDMQAILKNLATAYVKQNTDKIKQAVDNQVQKLGGNLGKNLQNTLQNGLNSLLK